MKKLFLVITLIFAYSLSLGQNTSFTKNKKPLETKKYKKAMDSLMVVYNASQTEGELGEVSKKFFDLGEAAKNEWFPYYYSALALYRKGMLQLDKVNKENVKESFKEVENTYFDAKKPLDIAFKIGGNDTENLVLQKVLLQMLDSAKKPGSYQSGGALAEKMVSDALSQDPKNPRVLYLKGIDLVNGKEGFGGNKRLGIEYLKKSVKEFKDFRIPKGRDRNPIPYYPTWGKELAEKALEQAQKQE